MKILLSTQSFHNKSFYEEVINISKNIDIDKIYITSSLMHELEANIILQYNTIAKVEYIDSNSISNSDIYKHVHLENSEEVLSKSECIYSDLLSSLRWIPITKRSSYDTNTFSMTFYYDVIAFWNDFFVSNDIDSVISLNDEHSSFDSILIRVAKKYKVKNILTCSITGAIAQNSQEFFSFYDTNKKKYLNLLSYQKNKNNCSITNNTNFDTFSDEYKTTKLAKIKFLLKMTAKLVTSDKSLFEKVLLLNKKIINLVKTKYLLKKQLKNIMNLKIYYDNLSVDAIDYENKYVYYCLHFDPEATTLPKDTIYSNQLLNIRIISSSLPDGWKLYVKEHPHQLKSTLYKDIFLNQLHSIDIFRSQSFYKYIHSIKNAELISFEVDHKKLLENAQYIVSNTGTVFRESTYMKKRCITFSSKSIYTLLDNVYEVKDYYDCKKLFDDNLIPSFENVDELFSKYSITINDLYKRDSSLLKFILENELYRTIND